MRRARLLVLALLALVFGLGPVHSSSAQDDDPGEPTLTLSQQKVSPGQEVRVHGDHWPASTLVQIEVCGLGGRGGSNDCATLGARSMATTRQGELFGKFVPQAPPAPCPCVVHGFIPTYDVRQATPIVLRGHPVTELVDRPEDEDVQRVEVRAVLAGSDGFAQWFGATPRRELRLEIENISEETIDPLPLQVHWGRDESGDGWVAVPRLGALEPGETIEVPVPVELAPAAFGRYVVAGRIAGQPASEFVASTSSFPWGFVVVLALIVMLVVAWLIVRWRRRAHEGAALDPMPVDVDAEAAAAATVAAAVLGGADDEDRASDDAEAASDEEPELVGAGSTHRGRTAGGVALAALSLLGLMIVRNPASDGEPAELPQADFCGELEAIQVVDAIAGDSPRLKVRAIYRLSELAEQAPERIRVPMAIVASLAAEQPALQDIVGAADDDIDAWNAATQAVYGLEFDEGFIAAAARIEKYAVEICGMEPSGEFNLDVTWDIEMNTGGGLDVAVDLAPEPELDLAVREEQELRGTVEAPQVDLADAVIEHHQDIPVIDPPTFEFDRSEYDQYGLDP